MKKVYSKPQIYIESFEISEYISTCGISVGLYESDTTGKCKLEETFEGQDDFFGDGSVVVWFITNNGCSNDPRPNKDSGYDGWCYLSTGDATAYFGS